MYEVVANSWVVDNSWQEKMDARLDFESLVELLTRQLAPNERAVVRCRFGLETGYPMCQHEIAERLGICRETARRVEWRAIFKMRRGDKRR